MGQREITRYLQMDIFLRSPAHAGTVIGSQTAVSGAEGGNSGGNLRGLRFADVYPGRKSGQDGTGNGGLLWDGVFLRGVVGVRRAADGADGGKHRTG
jgi:hypothetical protein